MGLDGQVGTQVDPSKLFSVLSQRPPKMAQDGEQFVTAGTVNCIVLTGSEFDSKLLDDITYTLSIVHPNRTFSVKFDERSKDISSSVLSLCHRVSASEHICSEIVCLVGGNHNIQSVLSLVRGNLLTGMSTELVLLDKSLPSAFSKALLPLSDSVIFSSDLFFDDAEFLRSILNSGQQSVDLLWLQLAGWRDQIREVFDSSAVLEVLGESFTVDISYRSLNGEVPWAGLLLTGWLVSMLSARLVGIQSDSCEFALNGPRTLRVNFLNLEKSSESLIDTIKFSLGSSQNLGVINIKLNKLELDTEISIGNQSFRTLKTLDEPSYTELLKRFYFVGESIKNYNKSLRCALEIKDKMIKK